MAIKNNHSVEGETWLRCKENVYDMRIVKTGLDYKFEQFVSLKAVHVSVTSWDPGYIRHVTSFCLSSLVIWLRSE